MIRVLWLCAGNICRSPCFAAALRAEADRRGAGHLVESVSAGVAAWCGGKPPHRDMVAAAAAAAERARRDGDRESGAKLAADSLVDRFPVGVLAGKLGHDRLHHLAHVLW